MGEEAAAVAEERRKGGMKLLVGSWRVCVGGFVLRQRVGCCIFAAQVVAVLGCPIFFAAQDTYRAAVGAPFLGQNALKTVFWAAALF